MAEHRNKSLDGMQTNVKSVPFPLWIWQDAWDSKISTLYGTFLSFSSWHHVSHPLWVTIVSLYMALSSQSRWQLASSCVQVDKWWKLPATFRHALRLCFPPPHLTPPLDTICSLPTTPLLKVLSWPMILTKRSDKMNAHLYSTYSGSLNKLAVWLEADVDINVGGWLANKW